MRNAPISTLPAEIVRLGSIYTESGNGWGTKLATAHHDSNEWVLELLVRHLSIDVDAGQPTAISGMRVIPPDRMLDSADLVVDQKPQQPPNSGETYPLTLREILDHVLVGLVRGVDSSLRPLNRQGKGIHDNQRIPHDLPLHETHNFIRHARPRMDNL